MSRIATNLFAQQTHSHLAGITLRLFAVAVFIGCFVMSQASVKAVTTWSDAWVDASNPDQAFIVGCGVTEATYDDDWELQSVKVTTTLRSANGRTFTRTTHTWSNGSTYSAIAEPMLQVDFNDVGDYTVNSHHYSTCPATNLGNTFADFPISLKKTAWANIFEGLNSCGYSETCTGRCTDHPFTGEKLYDGTCPGPYVQCMELYAGACFPATRVCTQQSGPGTCDP